MLSRFNSPLPDAGPRMYPRAFILFEAQPCHRPSQDYSSTSQGTRWSRSAYRSLSASSAEREPRKWLTASGTEYVIRHLIPLPPLTLPHSTNLRVEPFGSSRETPATCIPNHLDHIVHRDGLRFLPGRSSPRQCRSVCHQVGHHGLSPLDALAESLIRPTGKPSGPASSGTTCNWV